MQASGLARIGRDTELRQTAQQEAVANLSLAFSYGKKDSNGKKPTVWVEASIWGKRAESLVQYLVKGQQVYVVLDDVHMETFTARDQTTGTKLVGRVSLIEFAGPAPQSQTAAPPPPPPPPRQPAAPTGFADMDSDDVPF